MKVLGIDEAGRGAVIGPMVICGLLIDEKREKKLRRIGVRDSKELTKEMREKLVEKVEKMADFILVLKVPACKIDANRRHGVNLNTLEARKFAEIIDMLKPDKVIMDAPGINTQKFEERVRSFLETKGVKILCEHFADKKYPVVSAASIIAKVERDKEIMELEREIGRPIGVGYSHDPTTMEFLEDLVKRRGRKLPPYVRVTWDTTQQLIKRYEQRSVLSFLKRMFKV